MASALIATVADEQFIDQAKQLFASVHFAGAWPGDYMLLSFGISSDQRRWFEERGVLVKNCDPLFTEKQWRERMSQEALEGTSKYSAATMGKFYLLGPEFRRWKTVVYLDCDIIVRAPLKHLSTVTGFSAVPDYGKTLEDQFIDRKYATNHNDVLEDLSQRYSLLAPTFNAGVLAFPTAMIPDGAFDHIVALAKRYMDVARYGDQLAWNLFFYGRWTHLSYTYNYFIYYLTNLGATASAKRFYGAVLHFPGLEQRPWDPTNVFHNEWRDNLRSSENMNVRIPTILPVTTRIANHFRLQWATIRDRIWEKKL